MHFPIEFISETDSMTTAEDMVKKSLAGLGNIFTFLETGL